MFGPSRAISFPSSLVELLAVCKVIPASSPFLLITLLTRDRWDVVVEFSTNLLLAIVVVVLLTIAVLAIAFSSIAALPLLSGPLIAQTVVKAIKGGLQLPVLTGG